MGFWNNAASHWWIILIIVVLVFGAAKLPALARSIGQSVNILKQEVKRDGSEPAATETDEQASGSDRK
ncbi:twin-arginine translocase TatA/TatE family subunit [Agrococcus sp. HG114]|uniref:twin-arginine translocase TatA/TatE family subunit n=1 Tax=Agrococcus sp. HG114 TaxID=2969757 RepID=UPI00215ADBD1|nr:twin-arginine translocase TatA/TatE family subunit [Agrococcus sp. HG114]MCR8669710.1 twin-arginine translocase TatA/TatE family subunit [Agrococcus sp. HG114]